MTLKYKLDDVVVLGDNVSVNYRKTFVPRAIVKITQLCCVDGRPEDAHYTIELVSSSEGPWWVKDDEINHEATEALQKSNETMDIVGKEQAISDDNAQEVRTPGLKGGDENGWFKRGELPPVGSKVIFYSDDFDNEGYWHNKLTNNSEVEIIAHFATDGSETLDIAAFTFRYESNWIQVEQAVACCFRPIKTAEEIEEEERQNTINKMLEIVKGSCALFDAERAKVEALYDAGYRFVGEGK